MALLAAFLLSPLASAFEKQPAAAYHARRTALGARLQGGIAVLFAAPEPLLDFDPYRQDSNFFYLTGWTEPGAALLIAGSSGSGQGYKEILFLPTRNLRMEKYTGAKMDASTPGVEQTTGFDAVEPMTALPTEFNKLVAANRGLAHSIWTQPGSQPAQALLTFNATTFGVDETPTGRDVSALITPLREEKDAGEIDLLKKASTASIAAQRAMFLATKPGVTERTLAGKMTEVWFEQGCERPSYAPIVGSGINSTTLHYAENSRTLEDGDIMVVDAACEFSMYASDITRNRARQRPLHPAPARNLQHRPRRAAGRHRRFRRRQVHYQRPRSQRPQLARHCRLQLHQHPLGKALDGQPLGKYWIHGLGHMVGIDVHDPADYPAVLRPGMVFTIEPGVYIPEEKIGVRIECDFLVGPDGKLVDLDADLPHTADDVEAAMRAK